MTCAAENQSNHSMVIARVSAVRVLDMRAACLFNWHNMARPLITVRVQLDSCPMHEVADSNLDFASQNATINVNIYVLTSVAAVVCLRICELSWTGQRLVYVYNMYVYNICM